MTQTILKDNLIKKLTEIEKLQLQRKNYYHELKIELKILLNRKIALIKAYNKTVKEIDNEIKLTTWRNKHEKTKSK